MRTTGVVFIMGISVGVIFTLGDVSAQTQFTPLLGMARFCDVPVYSAPNPNIASVRRYGGRTSIIIDPSAQEDERWLRFIVAHECAHVKLGHLFPPSLRARRSVKGGVLALELDADCWAARHAPRLAVEYAYSYFRKRGDKKTAGGYPTGKQRAQNIRECRGF